MSETSDETLIRHLQDGKREALNVLMERYQKKLTRFVHHYIQDESAVDDVVQDTFVKIYFNAQSFRFESRFSTWMFQIAVNLCKDHARKKGHKFVSIDDETAYIGAAILSDSPTPEDTTSSRLMLEKLSVELQKLPEKLRTALIAYALEEQSQEECAKLLGTTAKTIETRVYRARKILSERLFKSGKRQ